MAQNNPTWHGPFSLENDVVNRELDLYLKQKNVKDPLIGAYVYGEKDLNQKISPVYIGRSDSDLRQEIKSRHTTDRKFKSCTHFWYCVLDSEEEAYAVESKYYHMGYKLNDKHPKKPDNNDTVKCPVPGCEYHE